MDGPQMLSGRELVAKGATRKVDGQLPQSGLKEVLRNGSWLEQKQIQSALEARKHLIAVERIEKSGSLSHAEWRDDLKLAEVTKQVGGHWQYMGHKKGKCLYLLPEETLFLIEINSLLLKHNEVTVSLQKAYALCLSEMSLMQYKVYASLSRLGYRVFRHKEPDTDETNTAIKATVEIETLEGTATEGSQETSSDSIGCEEQLHNSNHKNTDHKCSLVNKYKETRTDGKDDKTKKEPMDNQGATVTNLHTDIDVTEDTMETDDNCVVSEPCQNNTLPNNTPLNSSVQIDDKIKKLNENIVNSNNKNITVDDNANRPEGVEGIVNKDICLNYSTGASDTVHDRDNIVTGTVMDIDDDNSSVVTNCASRQILIKQTRIISRETNAVNSGIVYSVDEFGEIRPQEINTPKETDHANTNGALARIFAKTATTVSTEDDPKVKDASTNESLKHYQVEIKHLDAKIQKLIERKSTRTSINNQGLDTIQNFYKERIANVKVPDEKYLPRNVFLHKSDYRLNMDVVSNQNASNVSSDEVDTLESPSRSNLMNQTVPLRYDNLQNTNTQPRYPGHQNQRPHHVRQNVNFLFRPATQNYFVHPRYRVPHPFYRHQYMAHNSNMFGLNYHANNRYNTLKNYHYNSLINIVTRFKNGGVSSMDQILSLQNLLNTFNLRYNTTLGLSPNFTLIDTKTQPPPPSTLAQTVIVLDDEPLQKKPRLSDDRDIVNNNLKMLKELAAKLKDLHAKNLAVSRHRRVFSNAIKTFNRTFKADLYLNDSFEIVDRKLVVLDSSSDSDAVVAKEKERPKKRKKLRNPFSILKNVNDKVSASTSRQVPVLQMLSLNVVNRQNNIRNDEANVASVDTDNSDKRQVNFSKVWFPSEDDFGRAALCSRQKVRLDALLYHAEYLHDIIKYSQAGFENWMDIKLYILKEMRESFYIQKQQADALSNDFFMEVESQVQPILGKDCTDLPSALKELAIIPTCKDIPAETNLRIHFDVCNRDVPFKKSNPPKPNFRVVCYDESAAFPSGGDVAALRAKYEDGVPMVFAFVGINASISYLQMNSTELPVYIPDHMA